jgi:hypothetical protein
MNNVSHQSIVQNEVLANQLLESVKPQLMALSPEQFEVINTDVKDMCSAVLGTMRELRSWRERIAKELPSFDLARFDKLEDFTHALTFAHAQYLTATEEPDSLDDVFEDAVKLRDVLLSEVRLLVSRGVVNAATLDDLQGSNGFKNVAMDLMALMNVLLNVWPQIKDKTFLSNTELNLALQYGTWLMRTVGERAQGPAVVAAATDLRNRAFTLVMVTYEDARRALTYLLDDKDKVDDVLPGLRPGRPRKVKVGEPVGDGGTTPPTTGNATGGVPVTPVTAATAIIDEDDEGPFVKA